MALWAQEQGGERCVVRNQSGKAQWEQSAVSLTVWTFFCGQWGAIEGCRARMWLVQRSIVGKSICLGQMRETSEWAGVVVIQPGSQGCQWLQREGCF